MVNARLRLTAIDQFGGSDVAAVQVSSDSNFAGASWQPFTDTIDVDAQPGARLYVRVRDSVGNLSAPATITLSTAAGEPRAVYLALMRW